MAIDDLIGMKLNVPPDAIDDLARVPAPPQRLAILGKTKSLSRLGAWPKVEALWIGDANESQFREILPLIDPLYLNFNGLRVADLSPLGGLHRLQALEITWNTKVSDISFLAGLTSLRLLALSHCPKVHDLRPVANRIGSLGICPSLPSPPPSPPKSRSCVAYSSGTPALRRPSRNSFT